MVVITTYYIAPILTYSPFNILCIRHAFPKCHVAYPELREKELICSIDPLAICKMNEVELKWMEGVTPPQSDARSPTISQLADELKVEAHNWKLLGTFLGLRHDQLAVIAEEEQLLRVRLIKVLVSWQNNATFAKPFKWKTVVKALRCIDNNVLADRIATKYISH